MNDRTAMPELPKHYRLLVNGTSLEPATPVYTAEQMHDYARAAIHALNQQSEPVDHPRASKDAERWKYVRQFLSHDDFAEFERMAATGHKPEEEHSLRADAACDAALAKNGANNV